MLIRAQGGSAANAVTSWGTKVRAKAMGFRFAMELTNAIGFRFAMELTNAAG
ncbi:MAG TPA: hypothetical protein VKP30_33100 [Polyangiaceae bacterium]|nr:hypothetical protein [Polyangiaceae bacterium]